MQLTRTTLRIKTELKKQAEKLAIEEDKSLQDIFNLALEKYLINKAERKVKKLIFYTHDLGASLDNLTRDDIYEIPTTK